MTGAPWQIASKRHIFARFPFDDTRWLVGTGYVHFDSDSSPWYNNAATVPDTMTQRRIPGREDGRLLWLDGKIGYRML
jgi:hypothetical protein